MARGMLFPAGLMVLIVVVLVHQSCSAMDSHHCPPSSCGNIRNISYPFRLKSDPEHCGDMRYNLSCENNQTVLYLYAGKYYVREINYNNYTIRVVDPGILSANDPFIPLYPLDRYNFSLGDPFQTTVERRQSSGSGILGISDISGTVFLLKCEKPVNSPWNFDITCLKNGAYSSDSSLSHSNKYTYYLLSDSARNVEDLCQIKQISLSPYPWTSDIYINNGPKNISCTDVGNGLVFGFELSWYRFKCVSCDGIYDSCYLDDANNANCSRFRIGFRERLYDKYEDIINVLKRIIIITRIRERLTYEFDKDQSNGLWIIILICSGLYQAAKTTLGTPFVIAFLTYKWRRRNLSMYNAIEEFLQSYNNLVPIRYSYSEIKKMTKSFKDKLGEGGYGTVFKGTLRSGQLVAIKMLGKSKANGQEFISEVATIGRIHHVNVVQLIGFCVEGSNRALVYEFMPNGSLNKHIFSLEVNTLLSYGKMYDIALGVARGIEYLHQGCDMQILHFDIKPHNILLDENFTPKVSDFGLAKLYPVNDSVVSLTAARGTLGYMAPELFYKNIGDVSYKADVYSFGMLLMEMAGRRKNLNALAEHSSQIYFPTWVYDQLRYGNDLEIEDATEEEKKIVKKMTIVALWCIQMKPNDRPSMNKVVQMLEGKVECLQMPSKPFLSSSSSSERITTGENSNQSTDSSQSSQF